MLAKARAAQLLPGWVLASQIERLIVVLYGTDEPGLALWANTVPISAGVQSVGSATETDVWRPCDCIADWAAAWVEPTTFGTTTLQTPDDVTSSIWVPAFTWVPAAGIVLTTRPVAIEFEHLELVVGLTARPSPTSVDVAPTWV